jgi:hypothetical protein
METRREDVPNWDSFNYINFIVAVEMEFGVKFKVADIESFPMSGRSSKKRRRCWPEAGEKGRGPGGPPGRAGLARLAPRFVARHPDIVGRTRDAVQLP